MITELPKSFEDLKEWAMRLVAVLEQQSVSQTEIESLEARIKLLEEQE